MSKSVTTDEVKTTKRPTFSTNVDVQRACEYALSKSRSNYMPGADRLNTFVNNEILDDEKTAKGDYKTNIQTVFGKTYCFQEERRQLLFNILEECRREKTYNYFQEKQGSTGDDKCGIMLDYDIYSFNKNITITEKQCNSISTALAKTIWTYLEMGDSVNIKIFYIVKPHVVEKIVEETVQYKFGFHILIPGVKTNRSFKKYLIDKFSKNTRVNKILKEMGCADDPENCLDKGSSYVPIFFVGSSKIGSIPYELKYAVNCEVTNDDMLEINNEAIDLKTFDEYNQVAELSLILNAKYPDKEPYINKIEYDIKEEFLTDINNFSLLKNNNYDNSDEIENLTNQLDILTVNDADALQVKTLLDLLDPSYYTDYNKWRNVIFALSNTSRSYKPIAIYFSAKAADKWNKGGRETLDSLWGSPSPHNKLTVGSIHYWAKNCNPERYKDYLQETNSNILMSTIYANRGEITHNIVAKVLKSMLGKNFCVDVDSSGKKSIWYEFVGEDIKGNVGELWKWREEPVGPDNMSIYISDKLPVLLERAENNLRQKADTSESDSEIKYIGDIQKKIYKARISLGNVTFKDQVIREAKTLFRRRGFTKSLNKDDKIIGVANGVLELGEKSRLIKHYHEFAITKYTPVNYKQFNPHKPSEWDILVLDAIKDIIVEPDARTWIMFFVSQCLAGGLKEGVILLWEGGGQNGKTSFLKWVAKALGRYGDKFNIQLLCGEREDANKPNSALAALNTLRFAYSEESNRGDELNPARMKEIVNPGEISCSDKNEKQETFPITANFVAASQYNFTINSNDHGTWRRIRRYVSKTKFTNKPDPNNIYEKKDNQKFVEEYPSNPEFQTSFFSIMVYFYERLQKEYGGKIKNVESPTIEHQTQMFRSSQDHLHNWLSQNIILIEGSEEDDECYTTTELANFYIRWYEQNVKKKGSYKLEVADITKEIESSAIAKFLVKTKTGQNILKQCRVDESSLPKLEANEVLLLTGKKENMIDPHFEEPETPWWLAPKTPTIVRDVKDYGPEEVLRLDTTSHSKKKKQYDEDVDFEVTPNMVKNALKQLGL